MNIVIYLCKIVKNEKKIKIKSKIIMYCSLGSCWWYWTRNSNNEQNWH